MSMRLRKAVTVVAMFVALVLIITALSAFRARKICDETIEAEFAHPPRYSMRFVLYPDRYIESANEVGFKPGWVVTYMAQNKNYGTVFCVSFLGKILARGTPLIVMKTQLEAQEGIAKFKRAFAELDAVVQVGSTLSNAVAALGEALVTFTNDNGSVEAHFNYMPRDLEHVKIDWLTNGFTLLVSNEIIVRKAYSYTSSQ